MAKPELPKPPEVCDIVVISWGGLVDEAEVDEVYGPPENLHLMVWVPVRGSSGEVLERHLWNVPFTAVTEIRAA